MAASDENTQGDEKQTSGRAPEPLAGDAGSCTFCRTSYQNGTGLRTPPARGTRPLLLTAEELALFTKAERRILMEITSYLTPDELTLLTIEDLEFCLNLEGMSLPDIPFDEAQRVALSYRDYVRKKLAQ